jgi:hypothetical protein
MKYSFIFLQGKYYLVDAGYANTTNFLAPYRGVRYHLREWSGTNLSPQNYEELFNLRHSSLRNAIERIFGVLKKRFPILKESTSYPLRTQVRLVNVTCILHNFIRSAVGGDDFVYDEYEEELLQQEAQEVRRLHGRQVQRRERQTQIEEREDGKRLRDEIAKKMYEDYISSRRM